MQDVGSNPKEKPEGEVGEIVESIARADAETSEDGDILLDRLQQWEERLLGNKDDAPESLGIRDPVLLEAVRERIRARKQSLELPGLSAEALTGNADRGGRVPYELPPTTRTGPDEHQQCTGSPGPTERSIPRLIGRYQVRRTLGQGGYGRVYLAFDSDLDRLVAIKVPLAERISVFSDVESYLREARMLARLSHPNIVPVYDVGRTDDGLWYVVSRYIDGGDLAARLAAGRYPHMETARLVAALAEALHYAHTQDLFHRDIKPANILINASGSPLLADFGLALTEEDHGKEGGVVGTAAYMSPEQARGEGHLVDGRSDIFSLAIVFFEMLTGRRPFRGGSHEEVMRKIIDHEPRPPRQIDDTIPRELERICMKGLSKRAAERYSTAKDLADDLRHFLWGRADGARTDCITHSAGAADEPTASQSHLSLHSSGHSINIVPKGLGAFDGQDADFFLDLLPGPRDRYGLPDALRFWKVRIEATDPDKTFRVGVIYGPSGCGKSSMVKAGLLPLLEQEKRLTTVYIEAAGTETEPRLLRGIRKAIQGLDDQDGLVATLAALRRGRNLPAGAKVVLVVDQLEQWLFARQGERDTELVDALRQCDGEHLQAICLVRDDFWMATTRFMRDIEIDLVPDRNVAAVDLFDPQHARKVLAAFGRAYGTITNETGDLPRNQSTFLDQVVAGVAEQGKVVPVRLALFAEMVKGKPWTPATLREVGGMDGIGLKFLEETFSAGRSSPEHQFHQKAAQAVLKSLLPETNTHIKGRMRSIEELQTISGYAHRPSDFKDLIRILDSDLRLITPVDLEASTDENAPSAMTGGSRSYQLTHDYLVDSLRDWLTCKQRETRRGRAELLLEERSTFWIAKPERRYLPSMIEWGCIRLFTNNRKWTESQRKMIRFVDRRVALGLTATAVLLVGLYWSARSIKGRMVEVGNQTHSQGLVQQLLRAEIEHVPTIVRDMHDFRRWTDPELERIVSKAESSPKEKLHASIALLPSRHDQLDYLYRILPGSDPALTSVLASQLRPHRDNLVGVLWSDLRSVDRDERRILPTASLLAEFDPASPHWDSVGDAVGNVLVKVRLDDVKGWLELLWNVRAQLIEPLSKIYRDRHRPEIDHTIATTLLSRYLADQPEVAADLVQDADPHSFSILLPLLQSQRAPAIARLLRALSGSQNDSIDPMLRTGDLGNGESAKEAQALRRARAAVALVRLGDADQAWKLLHYSPDPTARSILIDAFHSYDVPLDDLIRELDRLVTGSRDEELAQRPSEATNAFLFSAVLSRKRAIIQAMAAYAPSSVPSSERDALIARLVDLHRSDPDPGVHAAAELLLRRWGRGDAIGLNSSPREKAGTGKGRWYVSPAGHIMVMIDGPVVFQMGSPDNDPERENGDIYHRRCIPRSFAIASQEVTVRDFETFVKATGRRPPSYSQRYSPDQDGPQVKIKWQDAAEYCNWLSRQENRRECYELINQAGAGMAVRVNAEAAAAGAYRLPTEAEWEYACRAGSTACRYYGRVPWLLKKYEWYADNSDGHAHACGSLLPNDLGLFDMLGNASEWCHDRFRDPERRFNQLIDDPIDAELVGGTSRHRRGENFLDTLMTVRAGTRAWVSPDPEIDMPKNTIAFRPARTVPSTGK